jgi:hypothetical protein
MLLENIVILKIETAKNLKSITLEYTDKDFLRCNFCNNRLFDKKYAVRLYFAIFHTSKILKFRSFDKTSELDSTTSFHD